jgi:hypothetical protein
VSFFQNEKARVYMRRVPILGIFGPNGHGKTLAMVWITMPDLDMGVPVLSTVRLTDFRDPRPCDGTKIVERIGVARHVEACELDTPGIEHWHHNAAHPAYIPCTSYAQLVAHRDGVLLLDEVTGGFSSRSSMSMPGAVMQAIMQMRKLDRVVRYSAPAWSRTDVALRQVTIGATLCTGFASASVEGRQWRSNRLFRWLTYDARKLDDVNEADRQADKKRKRLKADRFCMHWAPGSGVFDAFDTYSMADTLGGVDESGKCLKCNKVKTQEKCKC